MGARSIADTIRDDITAVALDGDTRAAVDQWLAADREFNSWFLGTTKRALGDDELMALLDGYREAQETVEDAWAAFRDEPNTSALRASLAISLGRIHGLMQK